MPCWLLDSKGCFFVKNAYKEAHNHQISRKIVEVVNGYHKHKSLELPKPLWQTIWELKIPPKVHVFN